jgi:hypothetical protein
MQKMQNTTHPCNPKDYASPSQEGKLLVQLSAFKIWVTISLKGRGVYTIFSSRFSLIRCPPYLRRVAIISLTQSGYNTGVVEHPGPIIEICVHTQAVKWQNS